MGVPCGQVSDRQFRETYVKDTASDLVRADAMIAAGQGDDILKREQGLRNTPITANRFKALAARGGDDDMFSSDLSDDDLKVRTLHFCDLVCCDRNWRALVCSEATTIRSVMVAYVVSSDFLPNHLKATSALCFARVPGRVRSQPSLMHPPLHAAHTGPAGGHTYGVCAVGKRLDGAVLRGHPRACAALRRGCEADRAEHRGAGRRPRAVWV